MAADLIESISYSAVNTSLLQLLSCYLCCGDLFTSKLCMYLYAENASLNCTLQVHFQAQLFVGCLLVYSGGWGVVRYRSHDTCS